jgi:hypothetical protein
VRNARERYLLGDHRGHAQGCSLVTLYAESENNYSSFMLPVRTLLFCSLVGAPSSLKGLTPMYLMPCDRYYLAAV